MDCKSWNSRTTFMALAHVSQHRLHPHDVHLQVSLQHHIKQRLRLGLREELKHTVFLGPCDRGRSTSV